MLGSSSSSSGEVEKLLDNDPNAPLEKLLECPNLVAQFRGNNEKLVNRFSNEALLIDLYKTIMTTKEKAKQKLITSLFQTSNTQLHEVFSTNLKIAEFAISALEIDTETGQYAVGVISRFLCRAFDLWPDECTEVFRVSKTIYPTLIKNLHLSCVYQSIVDLMNDNHKGLTLFMWHCFCALSLEEKKKYEGKNRPKCVFLEKDLDFSEIFNENSEETSKNSEANSNDASNDGSDKALHEAFLKMKRKTNQKFTEIHKNNIIDLLKQFFEFKKGKAEGFEDCMMDYIANATKLSPALFEVAKFIGPNESVAKRALEYITLNKYSDNVPDMLIEKPLLYLSICTDILKYEDLEALVFFSLYDERSTNFVSIAGSALAKSLSENPKTSEKFKKNIASIIAFVWNNKYHKDDGDNSRNILFDDRMPFILDVAALLDDFDTGVKGWDDFRDKCVKPWRVAQLPESEAAENLEPVDASFKFEGGAWDEKLIGDIQTMG